MRKKITIEVMTKDHIESLIRSHVEPPYGFGLKIENNGKFETCYEALESEKSDRSIIRTMESAILCWALHNIAEELTDRGFFAAPSEGEERER